MNIKVIAAVTACALALVGVADTVADRIRAKNAAELAAYTVEWKEGTGAARFDFKGNGGKFTILANGAKFVTKWSSCSRDSVHAYSDYVDVVGWNHNQTSFPSAASEFEAWDWKRRAIVARAGMFIAFMEKGGGILAVRVVDVKDRDRGADADMLSIEYRVYGVSRTRVPIHISNAPSIPNRGITRQQADRMFEDAERSFKALGAKFKRAATKAKSAAVIASNACEIARIAHMVSSDANAMADMAVDECNTAIPDFNTAVDKFNAALDAYKTFTPTNAADKVRIERIISKAKRAKMSTRRVGRSEQTNSVDRVTH